MHRAAGTRAGAQQSLDGSIAVRRRRDVLGRQRHKRRCARAAAPHSFTAARQTFVAAPETSFLPARKACATLPTRRSVGDRRPS